MRKRELDSLASEKRIRKKLSFFHWSFGVILFILVPVARILVWRDFLITWFIPATLLLCAEGSMSHLLAGLLHLDARISYWKTSNTFTTCLVLFLLMCSLGISAVCSLLSLVGPLRAASCLRMPMSNIKGIHVDDVGFVYCADLFYSRIQVFDNEGNFIKGWLTPRLRGAIRLSANDEGEVQIINESKDTIYTYSAEGKLLSRWPITGPTTVSIPKLVCQDQHGNEYRATSSMLSWRIEKTSGGGKEVLVSDPFSLWLIRFPLPGVALVLISGLCCFSVKRGIYYAKIGYRKKK